MNRSDEKCRNVKSLDTPNSNEQAAKPNKDNFQRGRYLRSSYDRSLLMYSQRSGINDITNNAVKAGEYSTTIDKLLAKFRSKLQGLKSPSNKGNAENQAQGLNNDETLVI